MIYIFNPFDHLSPIVAITCVLSIRTVKFKLIKRESIIVISLNCVHESAVSEISLGLCNEQLRKIGRAIDKPA